MLKSSLFTLIFKVASFCLKSKLIKVGLCHSYAFGDLDALVFPLTSMLEQQPES